MERLKLLQKRLHVVKKQKELLMLEEAKLIRVARQKKASMRELAKVKKEKIALMAEEAKLVRVLKQNGYPAI
ncbi:MULTISPECIES: hypothetical protein [Thermococcus]|uniref:Uncharacterized protein n=1 Tax=Thermococcus thioreducens TaxID=277988 RepID=A0A0Q2S6L0_9EURY|nr:MULTISPECIES: hypothetical protein [Thermococcus]ASJ12320.1 hypothetical protein A3L14_05190 [Thermococcus thioreducens]KQH83051.1 hypothetical protein AMR53_02185 [Thermococcus thioreducens]NJE06153.1 hypothetical protein [Thermococcus sp. M36]SEV92883.1 hypothetical protein SAMN05216170_0923 [Thermococcus thioreducens]